MQDFWFPSHLVEIPSDECLELLTNEPAGRVAYCDLHGPVVLPVNHVVHSGEVWFRTSPYSEMVRHFRHAGAEAPAAFQVDGFESHTQSGWSVLVRGSVALVSHDDPPDFGEDPIPWVADNRNLYTRIRPVLITGRRLLPA